jgi:hypothetical protein
VVTVRTARLDIHKFYVLPTQCVYVFCVDLRSIIIIIIIIIPTTTFGPKGEEVTE